MRFRPSFGPRTEPSDDKSFDARLLASFARSNAKSLSRCNEVSFAGSFLVSFPR
jgi:hypothetical protein